LKSGELFSLNVTRVAIRMWGANARYHLLSSMFHVWNYTYVLWDCYDIIPWQSI